MERDYPTVSQGAEGLAFVEACLESNQNGNTEIILLVAGGMNFFDSVCHSLTTTATGGYSTKQNSIAAFNSPYIENIITLFMFLAGREPGIWR